MHSLRTVCFVGMFVLGTVESGCSGPAAAGSDTGTEGEVDPDAPVKKIKRTYDRPEMPTTEQEISEILDFCEVANDCDVSKCTNDELSLKFKRVRVKSIWGKQLQKHFTTHDLPGVGRRLAKLVEQEGLHRKSKACREEVARFD